MALRDAMDLAQSLSCPEDCAREERTGKAFLYGRQPKPDPSPQALEGDSVVMSPWLMRVSCNMTLM